MRLDGAQQPFKRVELGGYNIVTREDRWNFVAIARFRKWLLQACPKDFRSCSLAF